MFINFWYPALRSEELREQPVRVQMLGCDFAVFRDAAGHAHCVSDTCVHRGGSLAQGKVRGDCIECPYHGWRYDGSGSCRRIPALGRDGRIPARAAVDGYPVREEYGLVFAFLGDLPESERPPLQTVLEWDDASWRGSWISWEWDVNIERAVENSLDPVHNEFVHFNQGFLGEREDYRAPDMEIREYPWGASAHMTMISPRAKTAAQRNVKANQHEMQGATGHRGPNQHWNQLHFTPTNWLHQYQFAVPVDANRSRFYLLNMRNSWLEPENDQRFDARNIATIEEDRAILEQIRPGLPADTQARELLVTGDDLVIRYRQALQKWEAAGWKIDVERMQERRRRAVLSIPSPARRGPGNWVLETVPLLPGSDAS